MKRTIIIFSLFLFFSNMNTFADSKIISKGQKSGVYSEISGSSQQNKNIKHVYDYTKEITNEYLKLSEVQCDKSLEPTGNGQHQWGSSYADWYNNTWGVVFEQTIMLEQVAPNSFHTNTFSLSDASGGYIGLQTHGINNDGSIQTNVRFSIWDTVDAEGGECSSFGGEGVGQTCVINPLKLSVGVHYTIKVERLNTESDGTWWQGSVLNDFSGDTHVIGKIKVPHAQSDRFVRPGGNFSEYFGPKAENCTSVPQSIVSWQAPQVKEENGNTIVSKFRSFSKANPDQPCSDAGVEASGEIISSNNVTFYKMTNGSIPMCWSVNQNCTAPEVNVTETSTSSISLSWNDVGASSYTIYYRTMDATSWTSKSGLTNTNFVITGLAESTTYDIVVRSVCPDGTYPYDRLNKTTDKDSGGSNGNLSIDDLLGQYVRNPYSNPWHTGTITMVGNSIQWKNGAGVSWPLFANLEDKKLLTNEECPYYGTDGGDAFILIVKQSNDASVEVEGFQFLGELYTR